MREAVLLMAVPHSKINIDMQDNLDLLETAILKYARGQKLKKKQQILFEEWTARSESHRQLPELFKDPQWLRENMRRMHKISTAQMWEKIEKLNREGPDPAIVVRVSWWRRHGTRIAAALLVFLLGTLVGYISGR